MPLSVVLNDQKVRAATLKPGHTEALAPGGPQ